MSTPAWTRGDRVVHATKPEWGYGEILQAQPSMHDGTPCQSLTIRFDRAGIKTLSTAFANLRQAGAGVSKPFSPIPEAQGHPTSPMETASMPDALTLAVTADDAIEKLLTLPDDATDPFRSLTARIKATLTLYRFNDTGASLLDWAAAQTGLPDPLSRFNRHELERHFQDFRVQLDNHLRKLVRDMGRQDSAGLAAVAQGLPPTALQALRRAGGAR